MQHRFATNGIMVGRTPTGNGIGVMQNDPYLKNLLYMALGAKIPLISAIVALASTVSARLLQSLSEIGPKPCSSDQAST